MALNMLLHLHSSRHTVCLIFAYVYMQEEEEGIGDVDLFTLSEDQTKLSVNVKWLQHLQV